MDRLLAEECLAILSLSYSMSAKKESTGAGRVQDFTAGSR
jgi:hypothetical protein